ncbi:MAG: VOC family protein [Robiginitomaculum sp.]|nr:VOC family protein [Robiginitomaculum sp.]
MLGYTTVGTNNFDKAIKFYDVLLAELGGKRMMEEDNYVGWAVDMAAGGMFSIMKPHDGKAASVGNGTMFAFAATSTDLVDKFYAKAIELGATCEGKPGPRGESGFYAGYFRDLDGNKLNAFFMPGMEG